MTTMHIAGVPVHYEQTLAFAKYYSGEVLNCESADLACKGGMGNTHTVS